VTPYLNKLAVDAGFSLSHIVNHQTKKTIWRCTKGDRTTVVDFTLKSRSFEVEVLLSRALKGGDLNTLSYFAKASNTGVAENEKLALALFGACGISVGIQTEPRIDTARLGKESTTLHPMAV
jgi:hypothetical protein